MKQYDFDTIIDRRGSGSIKVDAVEKVMKKAVETGADIVYFDLVKEAHCHA